VSKADRKVPRFLLALAHHYGVKAGRVKAAKGPLHLHTRRLERVAKHLRAAYDGIIGERADM
jgi:hypothetical protein